METTKGLARHAGLLYFIACLPAPFALLIVPSKLIVAGDATATADRVRASEALLRMGVAGELFNLVVVIFAVLALYRLFRGVSQQLAVAMATLMLISIPLSLANIIHLLAPLVLVSGHAFDTVLRKQQVDALVFLFLRLRGQGLVIAQIFWGLWLFPYGLLVIRSGFIPRICGVLLIVAGVAYVVSSCTSLFLPQFAGVVSQWAIALEFGEVPIIFWLLIWGAKEQRSTAGVLR